MTRCYKGSLSRICAGPEGSRPHPLRRAAVLVVFAAVSAPVLAAGPASRSEHAIDFDEAVNVPQLVDDLKTEAQANSPLGQDVKFRPAISRTERDCVAFSFKREEPLTSEWVRLESREYQDRCYPDSQGRTYCREERVWTERRRVRVEITGRGEMLPWERDIFEVCLNGRWLDANVLDASHAYKFTLHRDDTIEAKAQGKTASLPDPTGIYADSFHLDAAAKNFVLDLKDRWSDDYAGEQVVLNVILKRHRANWFDDTLVEKEIPLPVGRSYRVSLADFAAEFSAELQPGKQYYAKWRFKRVGKISKDKWLKYWETDKATFSTAAPGSLVGSESGLKGCGVCVSMVYCRSSAPSRGCYE